MASGMNNRPDECQICLNTYDKNRRPRSTTCGHSFCSECLKDSLNQRDNWMKCPRCRKPQRVTSVESFPINYDMEEVMAFLEGPIAAKREKCSCTSVRGIISKLEMLKEEQEREAKLLHTTSENIQKRLQTYADALLTCSNTYFQNFKFKLYCSIVNIAMKPALDKEECRVNKMLQRLTDKTENLLVQFEIAKTLNNIEDVTNFIDCMDICILDLEEATKIARETALKSEILLKTVMVHDKRSFLEKEFKEPIFEDGTKGNSLLNAFGTGYFCHYMDMMNGEELNILDVMILTERTKTLIEAGRLFVTLNGHKTAKINIIDGKIVMWSFKDRTLPEGAHGLQYNDVLKVLDPSWPQVFLHLTWGSESTHGSVFIKVHKDTPYGKQFFMLCTGEFGPSYRSSRSYDFYKSVGETLYCGKCDLNLDLVHAAIGNMETGTYQWPCSFGSVADAGSDGAKFIIVTQSWGVIPYHLRKGFGKVVSGLEHVNQAIGECRDCLDQIQIEDCGVVLCELDD